jgi:hypothetical protein
LPPEQTNADAVAEPVADVRDKGLPGNGAFGLEEFKGWVRKGQRGGHATILV